MNRAFRKRVGRLAKQAESDLKKHRGDDMALVARRLDGQQYLTTLQSLGQVNPDNVGAVISELSAELMRQTEKAQAESARFMGSSDLGRVACCAGCSWCCHEPLQVNILDAVMVAAHLRASGSMPERLESYAQLLQPTGRRRERLKEVFEPCPFLNVDQGMCSLYAARPVICRAYHSTDVSVCQTVVEKRMSERKVPLLDRLFGFAGLPLEGARRACEDVGLEQRPVVLALAVRELLADFEGVLSAWLRGEPVFLDSLVVA